MKPNTMTTSRSIILSAILAFGLPTQAMAADGWGSSWSFGPVHPTASNHIISTKTTIVPGRLPPITSTTGPLFLWPGLSNPMSDLIQTTMDAWPDNASYCGAATGQWCVEASVFGSFGQRNGPTVAIDPDDHVTIEYVLGTDNKTWTQTVTSQKLGKVVSTLTSTSGLMPGGGFGFATEADADSFTIDTQYYLCTEIHLAVADPNFAKTGAGGIGAKYGATGTGSGIGTAKNVHTPDGGLTWLVDLITLPAMQPQGTQTPAPAVNCTPGGTGGTGGAGGTSGSGGASGASGTAGASGTIGSGGASGASGTGGASGTVGASGASGASGMSAGGANVGGESTAGMAGSAPGGASGSAGIGSGGRASGTGGMAGNNLGGAGGNTGGDGNGAGQGGSDSGGDTAKPTTAANQPSGCACRIEQGERGNAGRSWLLLGFVAAFWVRRRVTPRSRTRVAAR